MNDIKNRFITYVCILTMLASLCGNAFADSEGEYKAEEYAEPTAENSIAPAPWDHIVSVAAGEGFTVGLRSDGRVAYAGDNDSESIRKIAKWQNIVRVEVVDRCYIVGYHPDGSVALTSIESYDWRSDEPWHEEDISDWNSIEQLCFATDYCAARLSDGSVVTRSRDDELAEKIQYISEWKNIVQILIPPDVYRTPLFGLCADGTVESMQSFQPNDERARKYLSTDEWSDVIRLFTDYSIGGANVVYGITKDGTVYGLESEQDRTDYDPNAISSWLYEIPSLSELNDIADIDICVNNCFYGITKDGRIHLYTPDMSLIDVEQTEVCTWKDIVQFCSSLGGEVFVPAIGLKADGTVVSICDVMERDEYGYHITERDISGWHDIKKLVCGEDYTIGLRNDGSVEVTGCRGYNPALYEIEEWTDITDIVTRKKYEWARSYPEITHFVGLRHDGTVVAAGDNSMGQCNVSAESTRQKEITNQEERICSQSAEDGRIQVTAGTCGDNLSWILDDTGTLTISGTGKMRNYIKAEDSPWFQSMDITTVILESGVESIGDYAFSGCSSLRSVTIADGVYKIGRGAFSECTAIEKIVIPSSVERISYRVFYECTELTDVWISEGVNVIGREAFSGCIKLCEIYLPDSICAIGDGAFSFCEQLASVGVPEAVTTIGHNTFESCISLKEISMPPETEYIAKDAFFGCVELEEICLPDSLKSIGDGAFGECCKITNIMIPAGVDRIGYRVFAGCHGLKSITFPDSITMIDVYAFSGCTGLTGIVLPAKLQWIDGGAFADCQNLKTIMIPNNVRMLSGYAFDGCCRLETIEVGRENNCYTSVDGILFDNNGKRLVRCPEGKTGLVVIPEGTVEVRSSAFYQCNEITAVTIPDGFTDYGCFNTCKNLEAILANDTNQNFTAVEGVLFNKNGEELLYCPKGKTGAYVVPAGVTKIGKYAFSNCTELTEITVPVTVTMVERGAFERCKNLKKIIYDGNREQWEAIEVETGNKLPDTKIVFAAAFPTV